LKQIPIYLCFLITANTYAQENTGQNKATYLCIAEHASYVTTDGKGKLNSDSGTYDKKYIINPKNGLREFGSDYDWLGKCIYNKIGKPTWCESSTNGWGGEFIMHNDNTFVLSTLLADFKGNKGKKSYIWVIGNCSAL